MHEPNASVLSARDNYLIVLVQKLKHLMHCQQVYIYYMVSFPGLCLSSRESYMYRNGRESFPWSVLTILAGQGKCLQREIQILASYEKPLIVLEASHTFQEKLGSGTWVGYYRSAV